MSIDIDQLVLKVAERLREKATKQGRIPFLTGDLRKSIQAQGIGNGKATVGSNLPYARAVHDGRPAITIRPNVSRNPPLGERKHRDAKRARLKFKIGTRTVFAREVRQKARTGKPFLREAADEMRREGFGFLMADLKKEVGENLAEKIIKSIKIG